MMIKRVLISAILTSVLCFSSNLLAYSGDGDGTAENPYQISSVEDWQELMASPNDWSSSFFLTEDINLAGVTLTPVGDSTTQFTGVFDGNDNVINNALVNQPVSNCIGLFGYVGSSGQIHDLGVEDVNMTGCALVGGLVGFNDGTLIGCYTTGSVTGTSNFFVGGLVGSNGCNWNEYINDGGYIIGCYATCSVTGEDDVGGLVGYNNNGGELTDCYATGSVSGIDEVGGLVGWNYSGTLTTCYATGSVTGEGFVGGLAGMNYGSGTVADCYATGSVNGEHNVGGLVGLMGGDVDVTLTNCYAAGSVTGEDLVGGLVGFIYMGTITDCFWDIETTGQTTSSQGCGTGKTTVEMKTLSTFISAGWDFVNETENGTDDIWIINEHVDYPSFSGYPSADDGDGEGTAENPHQIGSVEDWQELMASPNDWSSSFILTADINLAGVTVTPVGDSTTQFTGVFDGNDNIITNVLIDQPGDYYIGLFGCVDSNGQIHDLGVEDVNVISLGCVGGLVGRNYGTLDGCHAVGSVTGVSFVMGGLVGRNYGTLAGCYATCSVNGGLESIGGLVGWNDDDGTVTACYATGSVSGLQLVGGLAGNNQGTLTDCYATGLVNGEVIAGGLVGYNHLGTITRCYATGLLISQDVGGLVCACYGGAVTACFWDIETTGQTTSQGGTGKSTVEMKTLSTFTSAGWDFVDETENGTDDIWTIDENVDYPKHVWSLVDFIGSSEVDFADYSFFANQWLQTNCGASNDCEGTDLDFSGAVDGNDLKIFTDKLLQ